MAFANREVEATLQSKFAFTPSNQGADHRWFALKLPGLQPIVTKFSHAKQDIGNTLWNIIAKQLRVTSPYLTGMIDCRNSREAYYRKLMSELAPQQGQVKREASPLGALKQRPKPKRKK